jgi:hypothetical protein
MAVVVALFAWRHTEGMYLDWLIGYRYKVDR